MTTTFMGLCVLCVAAIAAGAFLHIPVMIYLGLGVGFVAYLFHSVASMAYAAKNPGEALLEGGELVKYHQIDMAAKNVAIPSEQRNVQPPLIEAAGTDAEPV
jgi:hypothetical protein